MRNRCMKRQRPGRAIDPRMRDPSAAFTSVAILVVDDQAELREIMVSALIAAGHSAVPASNGKEALSQLADTSLLPSLIVLDLVMPVMSGRQFLSIMRSSERLSLIPVLVISGHTPNDFIPEAPVVTVLKKSFNGSEFLRTVEHCLARASA